MSVDNACIWDILNDLLFDYGRLLPNYIHKLSISTTPAHYYHKSPHSEAEFHFSDSPILL